MSVPSTLYVEKSTLAGAQALFALRLSKARGQVEVRYLAAEELYSPEYCRLNSELTSPCLIVNGDPINGAREICQFLLDNYPGDGDAQAKDAGRGPELQGFLGLAAETDPRRRLVTSLNERAVSWGPATREQVARRVYNKSSLEPDAQALQERFLREIIELRFLAQDDTSSDYGASEGDAADMPALWAEVVDLLDRHGDPFLFGQTLGLADACLVPIMARLARLHKSHLEDVFREHPPISWYWDRVRRNSETQRVVLDPANEVSLTEGLVLVCPTNKCLPCLEEDELPKATENEVRLAVANRMVEKSKLKQELAESRRLITLEEDKAKATAVLEDDDSGYSQSTDSEGDTDDELNRISMDSRP